MKQSTGRIPAASLAGQVLAILAGKPVSEVQHLGQPVIMPGESDGPPAATLAPGQRSQEDRRLKRGVARAQPGCG